MNSIVLAGDSVFDNSSYTAGQPDVISHLRNLAPPDWRLTLAAIDGATTNDIQDQLATVPESASHLVLSVGGNDAMLKVQILDASVSSMTDALRLLSDTIEEFDFHYRKAIDACMRLEIPLTVCTIYHGYFPDRDFQKRAIVALTLFNDVILKCAKRNRLELIDLRDVCNSSDDFVRQIEPSASGGGKIAHSIFQSLTSRRNWN
ncbi:SGNH/GDSL hydrolase family protein [Variovorax sp. LjRoot84]|uniref:SGNH/GDSL hydrolase family protein n=1 Tax=Variovorax sp. LjRoot84 TaxID=3342340 RepID=UPI003ED0E3C0